MALERVPCRPVFKLILLLMLVAPGTALAGPTGPSGPESVAEAARRRPKPVGFPVMPGIFRLEGSDPTLSHRDLEPLRQIVGRAEIVALGESFHTSGGYYEMKHRVFRYLVERLGFRVFAIESPWGRAESVRQLVETCGESPDEAIRTLFSVWQSVELRDMVQWMCDWNRAHRRPRDRVHFVGFDTQQPEFDGPVLLGYLERVGIGADHPVAANLRRCDGAAGRRSPLGAVLDADNDRCQAGLQAVERLFADEEERLVAETSRWDLEWARVSLTGLRAWQGQAYYANRSNVLSGESRDRGMAEVLLAIRNLRYRSLKTAVWAHNYHIAKDTASTAWTARSMGVYLREALGPGYVALGLIAQQVTLDWPSLGECGDLPSPSFSSVETRLADLGHDYLLIDFDFPQGAPPFLEAGRNYQMTGLPMVPAAQFDGAIFLRHSRAMTPLHRPPCR